MTNYYVCDSDACSHVMPWPDDTGEMPTECENCRNWSLSGPFDLDLAEEISQVRLDAREAAR